MAHTSIRERSQIPVKDTWDLESIFTSIQGWEVAFKEVEGALPLLARHKGHLGDSPGKWLAWLQETEDLVQKLGKVFVYGRLGYAVETNDQGAKARNDMAMGLYARSVAAMAFAEPELMAVGFDTLRAWTVEEPGLAIYLHYFDQLEKQAEHIRSAEVEELLGQLNDPFEAANATHSVLANADLRFEPVRDPESDEETELAHSNIARLMTSNKREVRRQAWEQYADAHLALKNTMANCLLSGVKQTVFLARARGYSSALEAALKPHFIPLAVFHNMIDTYKANLPTWHRYWALRKRALGLDEMHIYDTRAALIGNMPQIPFEKAIEWICDGMAPLGEEYVEPMRMGVLEERWVDKYPNKGKRFGAFSSGVQGTKPFIMMSFNHDIFGLSTLAHELGHSMHSYFTWQNQPQVYSRYGLFAAEVASNFNQALVRAYLLETQTDKDLQITVIEEAMNNFHRYFFIMPTLARFELEIHERVERGEGLTAQGMMDLLADLFSEGYGAGVVMDRERVGSVWMQFSTHLYYNFYVYQYATGISGAHALAERVLGGEEGARRDYLSFLKAGGSMYPLEALKLAGVDLSTPEPIEKTFAILASMVDRLEQLVL